jgi:hypothetical protein
MDKPSSSTNGSAEANRLHPTLSRESTVTITPATDSQLSTKTAQTSAPSSSAPSPLPSREPSPTRPTPHHSRASTGTTRASSTNSGTRSRKNSQQELSPARSSSKPSVTSAPSATKSLSSSNIPTLLPAATDPNIKAPVPLKSPTHVDQLRESPRWPVSPRLRSPPPALNRPNPPPPRKGEQDPPIVTVQRPTPSPQQTATETQSDTDQEDLYLQPGMRTPARPTGTTSSTLETVQEVSPFSSPKGNEDMEEKLEDSIISETSQAETVEVPVSKSFVGKANLMITESGSESGSVKADRRSGSTAAPPLARQSSSSMTKLNSGKAKTGEAPMQSMTVETETVMSVPQVALAPGVGAQGSSNNLRTKPSTETIRPKKEKKKPTRKPPSVNAGAGEPPTSFVLRPRLRHCRSIRSVSSATDACTSPSKYGVYHDEAKSPRPCSPALRSQSLILHMSTLLTRHRLASSKADIFEAKVASAVEEANSSDSEETFVYDSNPPDRDRPPRFHSRTPSATSMVSQVDRAGMRSIHSVMENPGPPVVKKNMKFVNSFNSSGANDSTAGDEDGKGTGRSHAGSARGTARHHHHFGRWGRNVGNGHTSLFAEESPFSAPMAARNLLVGNNSRHSSGPPSPRFHNANRGVAANGKRATNLSAGYDLDDTGGADDETTPLIQPSSVRSARSGRSRRYGGNPRTLEQQTYRSPPSMLNRFASCLVLTVMLVLVISGAIGFMFATSQPLQEIELVSMKNVVASEQELMLDLTVRAKNPNVVVVVVDSAAIEVFAKSPHAGTDSEWWRRPQDSGTFQARRQRGTGVHSAEEDLDDKAPNMRLGTITEFDSPLSFEGSFFHDGVSTSTGEVRLIRPGNGTDGGSERWERILEDEFDLILKGVLRYSLPMSQNVRTFPISGRTTVKPNAVDDPTRPNRTEVSISL